MTERMIGGDGHRDGKTKRKCPVEGASGQARSSPPVPLQQQRREKHGGVWGVADGGPRGESLAGGAYMATRVRPAVAMDGGDITFKGFREGTVYLHMQGACSGCPSSTATLKSGIENLLRHFVPGVEAVQQV